MKPCRRCGHIKPLADFYRHHRMADGTVNTCKHCVKLRAIDLRMYRARVA